MTMGAQEEFLYAICDSPQVGTPIPDEPLVLDIADLGSAHRARRRRAADGRRKSVGA